MLQEQEGRTVREGKCSKRKEKKSFLNLNWLKKTFNQVSNIVLKKTLYEKAIAGFSTTNWEIPREKLGKGLLTWIITHWNEIVEFIAMIISCIYNL